MTIDSWRRGHCFRPYGTTPDTLLHLQNRLYCVKCGVAAYDGQPTPVSCPYETESDSVSWACPPANKLTPGK